MATLPWNTIRAGARTAAARAAPRAARLPPRARRIVGIPGVGIEEQEELTAQAGNHFLMSWPILGRGSLAASRPPGAWGAGIGGRGRPGVVPARS